MPFAVSAGTFRVALTEVLVPGVNAIGLAVADFNQAIRLNPREGEYVWGRGCTEIAMGDKGRGARDLAKAKEFGFSLDKESPCGS